MKFPRNARMFKGHLDAAPLASVFFCLLIFVLLASLIYTPGVRIELPEAITGAPAVSGPTVDKLDAVLRVGREAGISNFSQAMLPRVFDSLPEPNTAR